ncbi:restriction endonuclease subunit S [Limosilactobacillus allomucosae]|uniref:restriction endonuclease subunit S n=1 Tax=Limosilactobacillus allomucosae TaxID=3142938 RepID=UPI00406AAFEE
MGETFSGLSGKNKNDFGHGDASFITYMNVFSNSIADLRGTEHVEIDSKQNQVMYGDILFTTSSETPEEVGMSSVWLGHIKNIYLNSFCFGYRILEKQNFDSYYMAYLLRAENFRKRMTVLAQGISRYNISKKQVMNTFVNFPTMEEQRKIGKALFLIDKTITLHEEKQRQLEQLKKALLQKMFADKTGYPALRFKGFTEKWEQRKFSDIYKKSSEKNDLSFSKDKVISVANNKWGTAPKNSTDKYMRTYYVYRIGDIAFEGNKSKKFKFGRFVENTLANGIVSHVFDIYRPTQKEHDLWFWKYYIHNENIMRDILRKSTTKATMMTNLVNKDLLKQKLNIPSIEEQEKIGNYLSKLDHLITLHQHKIDNLKRLKRALLQKMFV